MSFRTFWKIFLSNCNLALEVEKHPNISILTTLTLDFFVEFRFNKSVFFLRKKTQLCFKLINFDTKGNL